MNKFLITLISIIGIISTGILLMPVNLITTITVLSCCMIASVLFVIFRKWFLLQKNEDSVGKYIRVLPFALIIAGIYASRFFQTLLQSGKIARIASRFGLPTRVFLAVAAVVLGVFSAFFMIVIFARIRVFLIDKYCTHRWWSRFVKCFMVATIVTLQFVQLEFSALNEFNPLLRRNLLFSFANLLGVLVINLLVVLIMQSWKVTFIITSTLFSIWSIVDYYVIMFHGSPMFFSELVNIRTAGEVVGGYHFPLDGNVITIMVLYVINILFTVFYFPRKEDIKLLKKLIIRGAVLALSVVALYFLSGPILKKFEPWMPWQISMSKLGFLMSVEEDIYEQTNTFEVPEGYSDDEMDAFEVPKLISEIHTPDIILIVNETFYDLEKYTTINADVDYMADFYSNSGMAFGYAVTPDIGGGTNNSESELLTSRSMMLLRQAPFTYLNQEQLSRSVVNYLNLLGYTSFGMHCCSEFNYSRNTAFPALGFDRILLGPENYNNNDKNGNRPWLDSGNYKDLISYYESAGDEPRFLYLLTFQNHGGYEQNDDILDTVHTQNDFGELTDDVNEFLSSIQLSCSAFAELIDYFKTVDRDVIICMVGDHAPPFASKLPAGLDNEIDNEGINLRCVPYAIWTNFDADMSSMYTDYASMVDLVPMVLYVSGLPLSTYYQEILALHEMIPIRTSYGQYVDREMNIGTYNPSDKYYDIMRRYYYLEYNSLLEGTEYREKLFMSFVD